MEKTQQQQQQNKKRKRKELAIFGNYRHYYGYRIAGDTKQDPRFKVFKKEWFEDKDCLDIGCNQGLITIEIAKHFCCRSIVGIDIDSSLVDSAYWNLKRICKAESTSNSSSNTSESDFSDRASESVEHIVPSSSNNEKLVPSKNLVDRVSFRKENIVEILPRDAKKYDTILCLSVTKWIHLNWGDDGLITLFANIWKLLRSGGVLVLEPQPWKSYQKNRLVSEDACVNYKNILFYPRFFQEILLDKIGFRTVENITDSIPGTVTGFDRPIFLFRK